MTKDLTSHLSLLIGNLWLPKPSVIEELRNKYSLPQTKIENNGYLQSEKPATPEQPPATVTTTIDVPQQNTATALPAPEIARKAAIAVEKEIKSAEAFKQKTSTGLINDWQQLQHLVINCQNCKLCHGRKNTVLERGSRNARWMLIGEGPGEQEDIQGKPFVGASGQLLDKMITAMQLDPSNDVYIANVVKCRPPHNRNPGEDEITACKNYLFSQIAMVKPQIIITLGRFAIQTILNTELAVGKLRGKVNNYQGIPVIATYHPSYLLRTPDAKKAAWADLQLAMKVFGGN